MIRPRGALKYAEVRACGRLPSALGSNNTHTPQAQLSRTTCHTKWLPSSPQKPTVAPHMERKPPAQQIMAGGCANCKLHLSENLWKALDLKTAEDWPPRLHRPELPHSGSDYQGPGVVTQRPNFVRFCVDSSQASFGYFVLCMGIFRCHYFGYRKVSLKYSKYHKTLVKPDECRHK